MKNEENVVLTDGELVLLDGKVSVTAQVAIDRAKRRIHIAEKHDISSSASALVVAAVDEAIAKGQLRYSHRQTERCETCGRHDGYFPATRKNPIGRARSFGGIELSAKGIYVQNYLSLGACAECVERLVPVLRFELATVRAELPEQLQAEDAPRWKLFQECACRTCKWAGHEGQLLKDYGWKVCPACGARESSHGERIFEKNYREHVIDDAAMDWEKRPWGPLVVAAPQGGA